MLKLENIFKRYVVGDTAVLALKGINIEFRKNEFVSILGPSGCGKTTLLNIIGGLDRYDSGDLSINGKSTKQYKDSDWDAYRNHSIGFVFQNYNLIPHQTVLSNVELALTLSGISKSERRQRAVEVLNKVGLGDQLNKKPNQMSGGQMQRVAIARALINNPDILLADEPTGALDSETSVQIMEILKEISKDKLVIMVTHNPDLAKEYSTRIVRLLDGSIIDDTAPYISEQIPQTDNDVKKKSKGKKQKTSMSFFTALSLSLNNLLTKKARTFMTAFAGSIGIIGIALILSLSNGFQFYIDKVQEDTLSSYPIMIESETVDFASLMTEVMGDNTDTEEHGLDKVYSNDIINELVSTMVAEVKQNNLKDFKTYIESDECDMDKYTNDIQYGYDLDLNIYSADTSKGVLKVNPSTVMETMGMSPAGSYSMMSSSFSNTDVWEEMLGNNKLLSSQYDVLAGRWPSAYNEVVLIVDENNEVSDYTLYTLGLKEQSELKNIMTKVAAGEEIDIESKSISYSYDEILNTKFKLVLNSDYYSYDEQNGIWVDNSEDEAYLKTLVDDAEEISIVGIIRPNEDAIISETNGEIGYTNELTKYVIGKINQSEIVKAQKDNKETDIFTGIAFPTGEEEEAEPTMDDVNAYVSTLPEDEQQQMNAYFATLTEEEIISMFADELKKQTTDATYESNLKLIGAVDIDSPSNINIYPIDFESKESIEDIINDYNSKQTEKGNDDDTISYTDYVGLMMSSVSIVVNTITYVLIAFVAISLIVSSIMIGIITYISVLERTKEIGILRSIGASKKDISRVFNAETIIVGFVAGVLGILVTVLLNIPINMIIKSVAGISHVASLPIVAAIILVVISMVLTLIAGLIPSSVAAKKDPVIALRTE